jgi:lipopolysaccharide/colanic/teichoic acid biosynthesis glycosyltransferase
MNRSTELAITILLFLFSLPFFALACFAVRITLGNPVFFVQTRAGKRGRAIRVVKLRTMLPQPEDGPLLSDADRVTPVSRFLRKLRLDELPQLVGVLRGDLALVGPRPLMPGTVAGFGAAGQQRGRVKPGITGWSQVSGNTRLSDTEKLYLDLWYIRHRSATLDFRILRETLSVAIFGERRKPERLAEAMRSMAVPQKEVSTP